MTSVPFELEQAEFRILIPVIPLPEMSQKECSQGIQFRYFFGKQRHQVTSQGKEILKLGLQVKTGGEGGGGELNI